MNQDIYTSFDNFSSQKKPLLKKCLAIGGPPDYLCHSCPGKCSYGEHLHLWEEYEKQIDKELMDKNQKDLDKELQGCKR